MLQRTMGVHSLYVSVILELLPLASSVAVHPSSVIRFLWLAMVAIESYACCVRATNQHMDNRRTPAHRTRRSTVSLLLVTVNGNALELCLPFVPMMVSEPPTCMSSHPQCRTPEDQRRLDDLEFAQCADSYPAEWPHLQTAPLL